MEYKVILKSAVIATVSDTQKYNNICILMRNQTIERVECPMDQTKL